MIPPRDVGQRCRRRSGRFSALELFAQQGYSATTTKSIAQAVGVTEGLIFHYFPTKGDLLRVAAGQRSMFVREVHDLLDGATGRPGEFLVQPVVRYDRINVVGADFSRVIDNVVIRGEAAYTFTADPNGSDPAIGNPSWQAVLGGEYAVPKGPRVVLQGVLDVGVPDQGTSADTRFKTMTMLSYQAGTRSQIDLGWMQDLYGSGTLLPRLSYTFADGVVGHADGYIFYGADGTDFGGWRGNSQLRVGLTYSF